MSADTSVSFNTSSTGSSNWFGSGGLDKTDEPKKKFTNSIMVDGQAGSYMASNNIGNLLANC